MPNFEVLITTPVQLEGAKALADQLERDIGKAKALGSATEELEAKLKRVNAAIASASDDARNGGEGFKVLGRGAHEAHAAIHALGEAIPGAGMIGRFLHSASTASIGVAVLAFKFLKDKLDELGEWFDKLGQSGNARGKWAQALKENIEQAGLASEKFTHDIGRIINAQDTLQQSTDDLIKNQKEHQRLLESVGDAETQLAQARVELAEKLGEVTPEQAVKIKLEIDEADFARKMNSKIAGIQAEIAMRKTEFDKAGSDIRLGKDNVEHASADAAAAESARIRHQKEIEQTKKQLEDLQAVQKNLEEGHNPLDFMPEILQRLAQSGSLVDLSRSMPDQITAMIAGKQTLLRQEESKQPALNEAAQKAKEKLDDMRDGVREASKEFHAVSHTLAELNGALAGAKAESAALTAIHNQTVETRADTQDAPNEIARRNILLHRAMERDHGKAEVGLENSQFNILSEKAARALNEAADADRHLGWGQPGVKVYVDLVRQLTTFLQNHPALQPAARNDMQDEIDALKQDIAHLVSRANHGTGG